MNRNRNDKQQLDRSIVKNLDVKKVIKLEKVLTKRQSPDYTYFCTELVTIL